MGIAGYKYMITYIREKMDVLPKKTSCEQPTNWWIPRLVSIYMQVAILPNGIHPQKQLWNLDSKSPDLKKWCLSNEWLSGSSSWVYLSR